MVAKPIPHKSQKPTSAPSPITFPNQLNLQQREEVALIAGWPSRLVPEISSISEVEDSGPNSTVNSIGAEGLLQILNHPDLDKRFAPILDPVNNFRAGYALYKEQGFAGAWTDWEPPGAYLNYMPQAQADLAGAQRTVAKHGYKYKVGSGGPAQPIKAQTTSFWSSLGQSILGALPGGAAANGLANIIADFATNPVDLLERGALMFFGGILVIVGLIMFLAPSGSGKGAAESAVMLAVPELRAAQAERKYAARVPASVRAERGERMKLAQQNAQLGERKLALKERREARLAAGKPGKP